MAHILTNICLPLLQSVSMTILPTRGLKRLESGEWQAMDSDPQFSLKSPFLKVMSGWISLRVEIDSISVLTPKLYVDFGDGYSESRVIHMTQIDEMVYQTDFVLQTFPKKIRFDPTEEPVVFSVSKFHIKVHNETLHTLHQIASIMKYDSKRDEDTLRILKKSYPIYKKHGFFGMLERLEKEYKKLHPHRLQRSTANHIIYLNWIKENERNHKDSFDVDMPKKTPLISVVMTTYNTPEIYLEKAINSVIGQIYPYWELCIADDASQNKQTTDLLKKYEKKYSNIHVIYREVNGNISLASNSALSLASGDYVALMDHDDVLVSNALLEVARTMNANPAAKFIYTDEDKIDDKDKRYDPHFKSDWNPDMFLSQNYISHLSVIDKSLIEEVGSFREGYEGAQDFDLFLRMIDRLKPEQIVHIDKILYHWRAIKGSTALDSKEKSYTSEAGLKALQDYFYIKDEGTTVEMGALPNTYKALYPIRSEPQVSLIIPTRDGYEVLSLCIDSIIRKTEYKNYEIIIIDNQTTCLRTLEYFDMLTSRYGNIRVIEYDKAFNYAAINNFGVSHARGEVIGLINNDVEVISDHWLMEMVSHTLRPEIGAVGAKLYYDNDTIQHAGVILGIGGVAGHSHKYFKRTSNGYFSRLKIIQTIAAVTAACLLIKKSIYEDVGGMDEEHLKVAFNDVDLCLKLHSLGYRNLWTPHVELYHHESVSRGAEDTDEKKVRFSKEVEYMKKRWNPLLQNDPYYNRNLTLKHENFKINQSSL